MPQIGFHVPDDVPSMSEESMPEASDELIAEMLAGLEGCTPGPWRPGHLADDSHSCDCKFIFGNDDRQGCVAEVRMDDGQEFGSEYPSREEAKRNLAHIARCSPDNIRALLARLSREAAPAEDALANLVERFSAALLNKLRAAEVKYGYDNAWLRDDWRDTLIAHLREHMQKGDPRDVAAYCAFAWHHGWSVAAPAAVEPDGLIERLRYFDVCPFEVNDALREWLKANAELRREAAAVLSRLQAENTRLATAYCKEQDAHMRLSDRHSEQMNKDAARINAAEQRAADLEQAHEQCKEFNGNLGTALVAAEQRVADLERENERLKSQLEALLDIVNRVRGNIVGTNAEPVEKLLHDIDAALDHLTEESK